jgi:hypothetical protein
MSARSQFLSGYLLSSTALVGVTAGALALWTAQVNPASAACDISLPTEGQTVTCIDADVTGVYAADDERNITVVLSPSASIDAPADDGIDLNGSSNVTLNSGSSVNGLGSYDAIRFSDGDIAYSGSSTVTLNDASATAQYGNVLDVQLGAGVGYTKGSYTGDSFTLSASKSNLSNNYYPGGYSTADAVKVDTGVYIGFGVGSTTEATAGDITVDFSETKLNSYGNGLNLKSIGYAKGLYDASANGGTVSVELSQNSSINTKFYGAGKNGGGTGILVTTGGVAKTKYGEYDDNYAGSYGGMISIGLDASSVSAEDNGIAAQSIAYAKAGGVGNDAMADGGTIDITLANGSSVDGLDSGIIAGKYGKGGATAFSKGGGATAIGTDISIDLSNSYASGADGVGIGAVSGAFAFSLGGGIVDKYYGTSGSDADATTGNITIGLDGSQVKGAYDGIVAASKGLALGYYADASAQGGDILVSLTNESTATGYNGNGISVYSKNYAISKGYAYYGLYTSASAAGGTIDVSLTNSAVYGSQSGIAVQDSAYAVNVIGGVLVAREEPGGGSSSTEYSSATAVASDVTISLSGADVEGYYGNGISIGGKYGPSAVAKVEYGKGGGIGSRAPIIGSYGPVAYANGGSATLNLADGTSVYSVFGSAAYLERAAYAYGFFGTATAQGGDITVNLSGGSSLYSIYGKGLETKAYGYAKGKYANGLGGNLTVTLTEGSSIGSYYSSGITGDLTAKSQGKYSTANGGSFTLTMDDSSIYGGGGAGVSIKGAASAVKSFDAYATGGTVDISLANKSAVYAQYDGIAVDFDAAADGFVYANAMGASVTLSMADSAVYSKYGNGLELKAQAYAFADSNKKGSIGNAYATGGMLDITLTNSKIDAYYEGVFADFDVTAKSEYGSAEANGQTVTIAVSGSSIYSKYADGFDIEGDTDAYGKYAMATGGTFDISLTNGTFIGAQYEGVEIDADVEASHEYGASQTASATGATITLSMDDSTIYAYNGDGLQLESDADADGSYAYATGATVNVSLTNGSYIKAKYDGIELDFDADANGEGDDVAEATGANIMLSLLDSGIYAGEYGIHIDADADAKNAEYSTATGPTVDISLTNSFIGAYDDDGIYAQVGADADSKKNSYAYGATVTLALDDSGIYSYYGDGINMKGKTKASGSYALGATVDISLVNESKVKGYGDGIDLSFETEADGTVATAIGATFNFSMDMSAVKGKYNDGVAFFGDVTASGKNAYATGATVDLTLANKSFVYGYEGGIEIEAHAYAKAGYAIATGGTITLSAADSKIGGKYNDAIELHANADAYANGAYPSGKLPSLSYAQGGSVGIDLNNAFVFSKYGDGIDAEAEARADASYYYGGANEYAVAKGGTVTLSATNSVIVGYFDALDLEADADAGNNYYGAVPAFSEAVGGTVTADLQGTYVFGKYDGIDLEADADAFGENYAHAQGGTIALTMNSKSVAYSKKGGYFGVNAIEAEASANAVSGSNYYYPYFNLANKVTLPGGDESAPADAIAIAGTVDISLDQSAAIAKDGGGIYADVSAYAKNKGYYGHTAFAQGGTATISLVNGSVAKGGYYGAAIGANADAYADGKSGGVAEGGTISLGVTDSDVYGYTGIDTTAFASAFASKSGGVAEAMGGTITIDLTNSFVDTKYTAVYANSSAYAYGDGIAPAKGAYTLAQGGTVTVSLIGSTVRTNYAGGHGVHTQNNANAGGYSGSYSAYLGTVTVNLDSSSLILAYGAGSYGVFFGSTYGNGVPGADCDTSYNATCNTLNNQGTVYSAASTAVVGSDNGDRVNNYGTLSGSTASLNMMGGDDVVWLGTGTSVTGIMLGGDQDTLPGDIDIRALDDSALGDALFLSGMGSLGADSDEFEVLRMVGDVWELQAGTNQNLTVGATVESGTLFVNGTLTAPDTIVHHGATLGGIGTVMGFLENSGTVAPGNSIGTLTNDGDFLQNSDGVLEIEFTSAIAPGQEGVESDLLVVTGSAEINGTVKFINLSGMDVAVDTGGTPIVIVDSGVNPIVFNGTVTGAQFAQVIPGQEDDFGFVSFASTPNGVAQAYIPTTFEASDLFIQALGSETNSNRRGGSSQSAALTANQTASLGLSPSRVVVAEEGEGDFWVRPLGRFGDRDTRDGIFGYDYKIGGVAAGASTFVSKDLVIGGALGFTHSETDKNVVGGTDDMDAFYLGFYADYTMDNNAFLNFSTAIAYNDYSLERMVLVNNVATKGEGDPYGISFDARVGVGMEYDLGGGLLVRPTASTTYLMAYVDDYTESGLGQFNMDVDSETYQELRNAIGVEFEKGIDTRLGGEQATIIPSFKVGVTHTIPLDDREGTASFVGFGNSFAVTGDDQDDVYLSVGTGFSMAIGENTTAFIGYDGDFNEDNRRHTVNGGFRITW